MLLLLRLQLSGPLPLGLHVVRAAFPHVSVVVPFQRQLLFRTRTHKKTKVGLCSCRYNIKPKETLEDRYVRNEQSPEQPCTNRRSSLILSVVTVLLAGETSAGAETASPLDSKVDKMAGGSEPIAHAHVLTVS